MSELIDFMLSVAETAGKIALARQVVIDQVVIEFKNEKDLVTEVDKAVERYLIDEIRRRFPSHGILAEESGTSPGDGEHLWVIDPIDGTTSFVHDQPYFSISIGLRRNGEAVAGVVNAPRLGEIYHATKGGGSFRNGERIKVSTRGRLADAVLSTGFACIRAGLEQNNLPLFCALMPLIRGVRRYGSAAIDLSYVACGRLDGFWEMNLKPYDIAAGELIVREAGGPVVDLEGGSDFPAKGTLATNGKITAEFLKIVKQSGGTVP
jgi:myo-inositol-1(or 4)-monophosphatase